MGLLKKYKIGGSTALVKKPVAAEKSVKPKSSYAITPKSDTGVERFNQTTLTPGVAGKGYEAIDKWTPSYNPKYPTRIDSSAASNKAIIAERDRRNDEIIKFRQGTQKRYGIDPNTMDVNQTIDPNATYPEGHAKAGERMIPQEKLEQYYKNLEWKNAYRRRAGFNEKQYYGAKEAKQQGYNPQTNIRDLNFGYRLVTGSQAAPKLKKGGLLNKPNKKTMSYQKGNKMSMMSVHKGMTDKKSMAKVAKTAGKKKKKGLGLGVKKSK